MSKADFETNTSVLAIACEPGKDAYQVLLRTELKDLQEAVGGYIEIIRPFSDDILILCNEEGKLLGLPPSRPLLDDNNNLYDVICGNCYIMADDGDGGLRSLTLEEKNFCTKYFKHSIKLVSYQYGDEEIFDIIPVNENGRRVKGYGR